MSSSRAARWPCSWTAGCFWHGCPEHGTWPKTNADWWRVKIETNQRRDAEINGLLEDAGWVVIRVWEHEDPSQAAERIRVAVLGRQPKRPPKERAT